MVELRLIRHALALAQHRNFARAAGALNIAQPSLSRSIAALERVLGVRLFDRSHKGVTPTPYGRVLLEQGEAVLKRETDLRREIRLLAGLEEGTLAVSAGPYLAETTVATAIGRLSLAHPRLHIRFTSADPLEVVNAVLAERIDVGVATIAGLDQEDRLVVEPLPVQRIYFACRPEHPLAKEAAPSVARVLEFPLGDYGATRCPRCAGLDAGRTDEGARVPPSDFAPQISVNSVVLARLIARESDAVFPGTAPMLAEDVAAGRLVRLDSDAPALRTNPGLLYLRGRTLAPAAVAFMALLRAAEREMQVASGTGAAAFPGAPKRAGQSRGAGRAPSAPVTGARGLEGPTRRSAGGAPVRDRQRFSSRL